MNILSRLNLIKQFQLKRLSHLIDHKLLYPTSTSFHHQQVKHSFTEFRGIQIFSSLFYRIFVRYRHH